ncbi:nucleoside recognition domain-containing protein [Ferruginibacter yonginensis]|uniref:Nucleoside recognition domain-containing protein n=1 Tax=Ferruginibacter yonginensis TaxID=1310416 RepID=A0ABV8QM53_9BACT
MALSRIWSAFIIIAISVALVKMVCFTENNKAIFTQMVTGKANDTIKLRTTDSIQVNALLVQKLNTQKVDTTDGILTTKIANAQYLQFKIQTADGVVTTCTNAVNICLGLIGLLVLFMGFLAIAEKAGGINLLSRLIGPFFTKIFPDVPKGHPAIGHMMMNFSANLLGLDNAATPFGLKAMESLQTLNADKERASNAQIMFLCLHASGLTLIPISIIALRASAKAANPLDIFIPCMIATFVATMAAMLIVSFKQKINVLQPVIILWVGGITAVIALLLVYLKSLSGEGLQSFSGLLSNGLILFVFIAIVLGGLYKKIDVFDAFIDGAKGGFETAVRIIPYLVGMLVAIALLRTSGTFDAIINGFKYCFAAIGADTRFVDGLPTALVKPFSGGAARGMMVDTMKTYGADSFAGRLACILQGSSDTTFYVIAVYFGSIMVKNTRYAIGAMLLADLVGIITAIALCYFFFG